MQSESAVLAELETSVLELAELFQYMARLVDKQSATLKSLEESVDATEAFTGDAVEELEDAAWFQEDYENKRKMLNAGIGTSWAM